MKASFLVSAACGLALTIIPSVLYFAGTFDLQKSQQLMTFGMLLWFAADLVPVFGRHKRQ
jgi:hypothetical protein